MSWQYYKCISYSNFANKRAIYLDGKISLAHARCTHLSQVIKLENTILYSVDNALDIFLPLLRRFNPAEPVVEKSVIL